MESEIIKDVDYGDLLSILFSAIEDALEECEFDIGCESADQAVKINLQG